MPFLSTLMASSLLFGISLAHEAAVSDKGHSHFSHGPAAVAEVSTSRDRMQASQPRKASAVENTKDPRCTATKCTTCVGRAGKCNGKSQSSCTSPGAVFCGQAMCAEGSFSYTCTSGSLKSNPATTPGNTDADCCDAAKCSGNTLLSHDHTCAGGTFLKRDSARTDQPSGDAASVAAACCEAGIFEDGVPGGCSNSHEYSGGIEIHNTAVKPIHTYNTETGRSTGTTGPGKTVCARACSDDTSCTNFELGVTEDKKDFCVLNSGTCVQGTDMNFLTYRKQARIPTTAVQRQCEFDDIKSSDECKKEAETDGFDGFGSEKRTWGGDRSWSNLPDGCVKVTGHGQTDVWWNKNDKGHNMGLDYPPCQATDPMQAEVHRCPAAYPFAFKPRGHPVPFNSCCATGDGALWYGSTGVADVGKNAGPRESRSEMCWNGALANNSPKCVGCWNAQKASNVPCPKGGSCYDFQPEACASQCARHKVYDQCHRSNAKVCGGCSVCKGSSLSELSPHSAAPHVITKTITQPANKLMRSHEPEQQP